MRRHASVVFFLASGVLLGQQAPPVSSPPIFRSQTELVLLSFHVTQAKHNVTELTPTDVLLLEDGKPRDFSIFDSPAAKTRMPLDLVLLFDTNPAIPYFWDPDAVYSFVRDWDEAMSRAALANQAADIRISVCHAAGQDLYRLVRATTDAPQLLDAFRSLLTPEAGTAIPLFLPPKRDRVEPGPFTNDYVTSAFISTVSRGWPLEAAIGTLNDVTTAPDKVARMLVIFSEGIGGTTTIPEDVGNHALDLGIPIYPIVTNYQGHITSSYPRNQFRMGQFAKLGKMTGGRAVEHQKIDAATLRMILESVETDGLSQYVVGFEPSPTRGTSKAHKLEIKLVSKSSGKLEGGTRRAIY